MIIEKYRKTQTPTGQTEKVKVNRLTPTWTGYKFSRYTRSIASNLAESDARAHSVLSKLLLRLLL